MHDISDLCSCLLEVMVLQMLNRWRVVEQYVSIVSGNRLGTAAGGVMAWHHLADIFHVIIFTEVISLHSCKIYLNIYTVDHFIFR